MKSDSRDTEQQEQYTHGYGEASQVMSGRSASVQASFLLPHLKPCMKLLDCGCGPGTMTIGLAEVVAPGQVFGMDIDSGEIERAKVNGQRSGVANLDWRVASAYEIPFPDAAFDAVFSHTLLEHLKEPEKAIGACREIIARAPATPHALEASFLLGNLLQSAGRVREAYEAFRTIDTFHGQVIKNPAVMSRGRRSRSLSCPSGATS